MKVSKCRTAVHAAAAASWNTFRSGGQIESSFSARLCGIPWSRGCGGFGRDADHGRKAEGTKAENRDRKNGRRGYRKDAAVCVGKTVDFRLTGGAPCYIIRLIQCYKGVVRNFSPLRAAGAAMQNRPAARSLPLFSYARARPCGSASGAECYISQVQS